MEQMFPSPLIILTRQLEVVGSEELDFEKPLLFIKYIFISQKESGYSSGCIIFNVVVSLGEVGRWRALVGIGR
jgi:hypothetical protein